jgi:hypothetical protein
MPSIFLSHSHRDRDLARRLREALQAHGIRTWLDEAEMQVGDSLISKIESAIQEYDYLGVVLSRNSIASKWVRVEVQMALTLEIRGERVKVLPLLFENIEVPGFLADKIYADFSHDFTQGFETLLARLKSDLYEEQHRQKRSYELLRAGYQDWLSFEKQNAQFLTRDSVSLVLRYVDIRELSLDVAEYLFCCFSNIDSSDDLDTSRLKLWLGSRASNDINELFTRLLAHPSARVRRGAIEVARRSAETEAIPAILARIKEEKDIQTIRSGLRALNILGFSLPEKDAWHLFQAHQDWLVRAYALRSIRCRSCLLISDGTDFAGELGAIARDAGYNLSTVIVSTLPFLEAEEFDHAMLKSYELVILVRGAHFTQFENEHLYSQLRSYVRDGGLLLATSWANWETKLQPDLSSLFPFRHVQDTYAENVVVNCERVGGKLAEKLFPAKFSIRTSYEFLECKENSVVLLKTVGAGIPLVGYHRFGGGTCWYLNSCQYFCEGSIPSPLTSVPLRDSLRRVLAWIHEFRSELPSVS